MSIDQQGWSGEYFSDIPVSIKAVPEFGFAFSHWANQYSLGDSINLMIDQNMTMIAHLYTSYSLFDISLARATLDGTLND